MRSPLPRIINVAGVNFKVVRKKYPYKAGCFKFGETDLEQAVIYINSALSYEAAKATLRHEMSHALWHESGVARDLCEFVDGQQALQAEEHVINRVIAVYEGLVQAYKLR